MYGPTFELTLLGRPRLRSTAGPIPLSPGSSLLCAYLALAPDGGCSRETAAAQLFIDTPLPSARRRLSTALWRLRSHVRSVAGVDLIKAGEDSLIQLDPTLDLRRDTESFESLVGPALAAPPEALAPEGAKCLEEAVALHRGQLVEPCLDHWVLTERTRIENLYFASLDYLVVHHGRAGDPTKVRQYGELALAVDPLREDLHRHLMSAYAASGRDDMVESTFERCRGVLVAELGVDPKPETIAHYSRLRAGERDVPLSLSGLMADLQRARRDVARISVLVDRAIDHVNQIHRQHFS